MTGAPCARLEQDALLSEISQDDKRPDINQQLADIVNKRWSSKLNEAKLKQNLEKKPRPVDRPAGWSSRALTLRFGKRSIKRQDSKTFVPVRSKKSGLSYSTIESKSPSDETKSAGTWQACYDAHRCFGTVTPYDVWAVDETPSKVICIKIMPACVLHTCPWLHPFSGRSFSQGSIISVSQTG